MRIPRLFYPDTIALDVEFELTSDAAHHVGNVLRLKPNHPVVLFNGDGNEYSGILTSVAKRKVMVEIDAKLSLDVLSPLPIHLGQGVSKGDRMDVVLQKSVELGVSEITPVLTERCAVKLDPSRWEKKQQQWLKIIIGACEQCGRNTLPVLHPPTSLNQWLGESTQATRLVLSPYAESSITKVPYNTDGFRLLIGPEGGLTESEVHQSSERGFVPVTMGPIILRTETAALAGISILQGIHGDL